VPVVTITVRRTAGRALRAKVLDSIHAALVNAGADILLGAGRSVKIKKKILADIVERLSAHGLDAENLMVVFQDVPWENWSPAGGRMPHG